MREKYGKIICLIPFMLFCFAIFPPPKRMAHPYLLTSHLQHSSPSFTSSKASWRNHGQQSAMHWQLSYFLLVPYETLKEGPPLIITVRHLYICSIEMLLSQFLLFSQVQIWESWHCAVHVMYVVLLKCGLMLIGSLWPVDTWYKRTFEMTASRM